MKLRSLAFAAALAATGGLSHASLVTNGGFESGLAGWSCTAPSGDCGTGAFAGPPEGVAHFWGFQNAAPDGVLTQSLATGAGESYSISFQYNSSSDEPTNTLSLTVGDLIAVLDVQVGVWKTYSGSFTASGASTALDFLFRTLGGSGTVQLDAVVVDRLSTVPAPGGLALVLAALGLAAAARRKRA